MAVASTNAWKVDIEETIINAIRSEFKATLPVFRSRDNQIRWNQFAILKGDDSSSDNSRNIINDFCGDKLEKFEVIDWHDAMQDYGCDKPDLRIPLKLFEISEIVENDTLGFPIMEKFSLKNWLIIFSVNSFLFRALMYL
mgnify:CR=1 FL=1